jgi:hypothetical protein
MSKEYKDKHSRVLFNYSIVIAAEVLDLMQFHEPNI